MKNSGFSWQKNLTKAICMSTLLMHGAGFAASYSAKVSDKSGGALGDAVVTLHLLPISKSNEPAIAVSSAATNNANGITLAQEGLQFERYVTAIRVGTTVTLPNRDKLEHHIKSLGPSQMFELKIYEPGANRAIVFDKPGPSVLICYLHGWMRAWVFAADTPFFGKTGAEGEVKIDDLKPGDYEMRVWHPDMLSPFQAIRVNLREEALSQKIVTEVMPRKRKVNPNAGK
jgi:plastocyanin